MVAVFEILKVTNKNTEWGLTTKKKKKTGSIIYIWGLFSSCNNILISICISLKDMTDDLFTIQNNSWSNPLSSPMIGQMGWTNARTIWIVSG